MRREHCTQRIDELSPVVRGRRLLRERDEFARARAGGEADERAADIGGIERARARECGQGVIRHEGPLAAPPAQLARAAPGDPGRRL
ncbi:hypothetical protein PT2222_20024 [Paraburkholderia tropica]